MWFRNTSRYADDEVRALVEFGMADVDHSTLAVRVKNSSRAYRGRAYEGVPSVSPLAREPGIERLVTIGIGPSSSFPCSNAVTSASWLRVRREDELAGLRPSEVRRSRRRSSAPGLERRVVRTHGYGGVRSPIVEFANWREALVAVAAHEARHIWQFLFDRPRGEVDAELWGAARLEQFRALRR